MTIKTVSRLCLALMLCVFVFSGAAFAQSRTVNGITISDISFPDAQVGVLYTYDLAATTSGPTASDAPYTYVITANALPAGINLSSDGQISGISCANIATYNFNLRVTSARGEVADFTYGNGSQPTLWLGFGPNLSCSLYVYTTGVASFQVNQPVSGSVVAGRGDGAYTYSVASGSLPPGVILNADGTFTGTPTTGGNYTYIIKAVDGAGRTGFLERTDKLVGPAPAPTSLSATAGDGQATIRFSAPSSDGGSAISNYEYSTDGGGSWTAFSPAVTTGPVTIGNLTNGTAYNIQLRPVTAAGAGAASASVSVTPEAPAVDELIIGPASFSDGTTGVPYSQNISPTGGVGPYICSNPEGPLPDGIQLLDNILAGTPTRAATDNFIIACQDSLGTIALKNYSITINPGNVLVLLPATMPSGTVGSAYATVEITRERGDYGDGPYTYLVTRGSLPPGLALIDADLTESGYPEISGTPTTAGTYTFTLYVEDSNGDYGSRDYTIEVTGSALNPATAPTGLTATAGNGQATISFTVPSDNGGSAISNYEYSLDGGSTWIALSPTDGTSPVTVGGLTNGTAYNIQLRAVTDAGAGAASASVSVTPAGAASAPTGLTATAGNGQATISFTAPSSNGGSAISNYEYSLDGGSTWIALSPADGTSPVTVGGLTNGTAYNIQLRPVTSAGAGAASASVSVTPAGPASAPTSLTATAGDGQATISFTAPSSNGGSPVTSYRVTASPGGITATSASSPVTVSGLTNGTSYTFTVVAITAAGDGVQSAPSNAVMPQAVSTISGFPNLNKTWGDAVFALTAPTSNSSGTFTYSSSNAAVATISGNMVTITGTGTTTITATQAANGAYASGSITATLTVDSAAPSITWASVINKTYGDPAFVLDEPTSNSSGIFTYASSNTAVATISGNTVTIVGPGNTTITASQAATANYSSANVTVSLTVGKAQPSLTWTANIVKTYGEPDFTLTNPVSQSAGAFTFSSSNPSVATVNGNRVSIVGAGTAVLSANQAESGNYAASSITTQLLVNARPDPSRDPGVIASVQTQVDASSRFALTQQMNIRDRLRQVRAGSNGNNNGISLNLAGATGAGLNLNATEVADAAAMALPEDWGWWTAGAVQIGDRKQGSGSEGFDFRSDGLTFGVDRQVGDHGVIGATFGRGWSDTEFDRSDSSLAADHKSLSVYGMYNGERWYIDGLVGYGGLDFEINRYLSSLDDYAVGIRSGSQLFGSLTMGYQYVRNANRFVGYARLDASHTTLDAYHESGLGIYDLTYAEQTIDSSTVSFGLESGHQWMTASGSVRPYWMFEYRMALDDRSDAGINYATLPASGNYILQMRDYATGAIVWGAGLDMDINERWGLSLLYRGERLQGDAEGDSYAVGLKLTYRGAAPANPVEASSENGMAQMDKADIPD